MRNDPSVIVVLCVFAVARVAFDREDGSNMVWPHMAASEVSLAKGGLLFFPSVSFCLLVSISWSRQVIYLTVDHENGEEIDRRLCSHFLFQVLPK